MKFFGKVAFCVAIASICSGATALTGVTPLLDRSDSHSSSLVSDRRAIATELNRRSPNFSEPSRPGGVSALPPFSVMPLGAIAQNPPATERDLGQEVLKELMGCVTEAVSNLPLASQSQLEAASIQCFFKVVMLFPDGTIRPDANERTIALVKLTGVSLPQSVRQGQASVPLQPIEGKLLFSVPVTIAGQTEAFLLDTGASNSMVDSELAQQLGLEGTPIPNDLLAYMVVGDNCSDVNANLHTLPVVAVASATVEGITGMELPKTAIPAQMSGVLGLDFLTGFDAILDPQNLQLQLLPPSPPVPGAIPLEGRLGVMTAQVFINDRGPFTLLLDTGAELMVVSENVAQQLDLETDSAAIEVQGFCGTELAQQTTLDRVSLQQHQRSNLEAVILKPGVLEVLGVDGIVGQNFLRQYRQHWRFGEPNELGFPETGSLVLFPMDESN